VREQPWLDMRAFLGEGTARVPAALQGVRERPGRTRTCDPRRRRPCRRKRCNMLAARLPCKCHTFAPCAPSASRSRADGRCDVWARIGPQRLARICGLDEAPPGQDGHSVVPGSPLFQLLVDPRRATAQGQPRSLPHGDGTAAATGSARTTRSSPTQRPTHVLTSATPSSVPARDRARRSFPRSSEPLQADDSFHAPGSDRREREARTVPVREGQARATTAGPGPQLGSSARSPTRFSSGTRRAAVSQAARYCAHETPGDGRDFLPSRLLRRRWRRARRRAPTRPRARRRRDRQHSARYASERGTGHSSIRRAASCPAAESAAPAARRRAQLTAAPTAEAGDQPAAPGSY
jgi:hypothetical protein